jgi:hypothetical protein
MSADLSHFEQVGQAAFLRGESPAPSLNGEVQQAISGLPVGGGARAILAAFSRGWHQANADLDEVSA